MRLKSRMNAAKIVLRHAACDDAPHIASLWCAGWRDGHLGGVPNELAAARTPDSFQRLAVQRVRDTTVATIDGIVAGFIIVVHDELEQIYVATEHRGRGVAQVLLAEAESQIAMNGFDEAWLAVVATN